jgi:hypothetical protein
MVLPLSCLICIRSRKPKSWYCPRCYHIVNATQYDRHARHVCLDISLDRSLDRFICQFTHIPMIDDDRSSPYYVHCIQRIPGNPSDLMAGCAFVSMFKSDLSDTELLTVIPHLDDHLVKGTPFSKDIVPFQFWNRRAPPPPKEALLWDLPAPKDALFRGLPRPPARKCDICIRPAMPKSKYCPRCRKILLPKNNIAWVVAGMKEFYDPVLDMFICAYTGVPLNDTDCHVPWYMVMDHVVPGEKKQVPSAFWVNDMKGCLTAEVFRRAVGAFADHIRTGEPFDTNAITKDDWKRNLIRMRLTGRRIA